MKRRIAMFVWIVGWAALSGRAADAPLASLAVVHALTNEQANQQLPAAFEATVTYFRPYEKTLFVQDGDAAIYVSATTGLTLFPGDRILVRGTTRGGFRPYVVSDDLTLLHHGSPPPPARATYAAMIRAELDCRYVTVRGTVHAANLTLSSGHPVSQLELQADGGIVGVTIDSADAGILKTLLDAEIEVSGAVAGRFDGKMQQTGLLLHATSLRDVKVIRPATIDAWSLPITPMDEVLKASSLEDRGGHVRVQGTLTYYRPTSMAVLQDGTRSIRVQTPQLDRLRIGDRVEAIGIPAAENNFLTLRLGAIRSTGAAAPIEPRRLSWDDVASGRYAFDLVCIEGNVVTQVREHAQDIYIISDGKHLFSATVRHPYVYQWNAQPDLPPMPTIQSGSRVRVTGVAILDDGNPFNGAMAFGVLLRTADDVAVLSRPSLLNVQNLLLVLGLLLLVVIGAVARGWSLERRVRREMAVAATLERWRSRILEDINRARPLNDIIITIVDQLSYRLKGTPCWCQLAGGETLGNRPADLEHSRMTILQHEIPSHSGAALGTMFACTQSRSGIRAAAPDALFSAAQLTALAIETSGLYSDLVHRSEFDLLTDVHNRFSLEKQLDRLIKGERREDGLFGLIYIDLDAFKLVNDQYGHRVGDLYLQESVRRMKRQLRPGDMLARVGGDEFAAIVSVVHNRGDVAEIANRLERCFDEVFVLEGCSISGSASVGIAIYPDSGRDKASLLSAADTAMYVQKNARRASAELRVDS